MTCIMHVYKAVELLHKTSGVYCNIVALLHKTAGLYCNIVALLHKTAGLYCNIVALLHKIVDKNELILSMYVTES